MSGVPWKLLSRGPPSAPMHLQPAALAVEDSREEGMTARRAGFANKTRTTILKGFPWVVNTPHQKGFPRLGTRSEQCCQQLRVAMSANPALVQTPHGEQVPAPFPGESFLLKRPGVQLDLDGVRTATHKCAGPCSKAAGHVACGLPAAKHMPIHHKGSGRAALRNWQEAAQICAQEGSCSTCCPAVLQEHKGTCPHQLAD